MADPSQLIIPCQKMAIFKSVFVLSVIKKGRGEGQKKPPKHDYIVDV